MKRSAGSALENHCERCVIGGVTTETGAEIRASGTVGVIICEWELERGPPWCLIRWFNVTACLQGGHDMCTAGDQFAFSAVREKKDCKKNKKRDRKCQRK